MEDVGESGTFGEFSQHSAVREIWCTLEGARAGREEGNLLCFQVILLVEREVLVGEGLAEVITYPKEVYVSRGATDGEGGVDGRVQVLR